MMVKIFFFDDIPKNLEILKGEKYKIFPLNFKIEKYLRENKIIPTDTSKWMNWEDFMFIDKMAMDIPMKWGLNDQKIEIKEIDLSLLIEKELFLSLLPLIHRIILIEKIIENTKPDTAVINNDDNTYFGKILKKILEKNNIKIEHIDVQKTTKDELKGDKISFGVDFFGKNFDITLKRNHFFILKELSEKYWELRFKINHSSNQHKIEHKKEILLLDFQLINYYSFLQGLSNANYNLNFLNSRRPIIWNNESLKISKKLNFRKMRLDRKNVEKESKNKITEVKEYLKKIQDESIFYIKQDNYSDIFQSIILEMIEKRIEEIMMVISSFEEKIKDQNIDAVVTLDDSQLFERSIILSCKKKKIPVFLIQNGDI